MSSQGIIYLRNRRVFDGRRDRFWCDLTSAGGRKDTIEGVLRYAVLIEHIVVREQMAAIRIRMAVCMALRRIGDLRRLRYVFRPRTGIVRKVSTTRKLEGDMSLIARDNALIGVSRCSSIRGEVETSSWRIHIRPIIGLRGRCYAVVAVVDREAVA